MAFWNWSRTPANNATAMAGGWPEGMAPSSVNDSARINGSELACYRDDVSGAIVTGGSSTAYTVTSYSAFDTLAHMGGQMIAFTPHATNGATVTLNVDGLGAKPLRAQPSVELPAGSLILGTPYVATYNNSDAVWYLQNGAGIANAYSIPLGAGLDYWGSTTPNSIFAFPAGQAISRTTYATLFTLIGTTYGSGDSSTTFNLPDKSGRVSAMKEATATRLTTAGGGVDGGTLGAGGGKDADPISLAQLPTGITSSGSNSITVNSTSSKVVTGTVQEFNNGGNVIFRALQSDGGSATLQSTGTNTINVTSNNTSGSTRPNVQPTIVCNYIMRVL